MTRTEAMTEARSLWGDLGTISSDDRLPRLVWCIGRFGQTIGRGKTWEIALERSRARKVKLDRKELSKMWQEAELIKVIERWESNVSK